MGFARGRVLVLRGPGVVRVPMYDKCGVIGIASPDRDVAPLLFYGLRALQHRGQESAGLVVLTEGGVAKTHKGMGLVDQVFKAEVLRELGGKVGVGHVRYSTSGGSTLEYAQPQVVQASVGTIAFAHNGDIVNAPKIGEELKAKGWAFVTENDTEIAVRYLANELTKTADPVEAIRNIMNVFVGSYSLAILIGERLFAVRDPLGIKPLVLGKLPDRSGYMVASESTALDVVGAELLRDVVPGEIVEVQPTDIVSHRGAREPHYAHCFFEHVYFARSDSVLDGSLVHETRQRIGAQLAREAPVQADLVVPVPDSGRAHAQGFAEASGIPYVEALIKNRYVHRTFLMPGQDVRELNVRLKLNPIRRFIEGKRVVLIDDSIVRGTTMRRIVSQLRETGATEVHVRVCSPPIITPCYLGIDMHTRDQLVASKHTVKEITELIGADSLAYISIEGLTDSLGFPKSQTCLGCVTGEYPVPIPGERIRKAKVVETSTVHTTPPQA